ncbi:MAG: polymer-forming cytoskeletal protein [bacterium]|nr:polymer-forming cytoskeletal protein [bacterium]
MIQEKYNQRNDKVKPSDIIETVMGAGTFIKGIIRVKNSGRIDGIVEGEVISDQDIIIGETGEILGHIRAKRAVIGGKVRGEVKAVKRVVLEHKADLEGDIITESLKVSNGAVFNGNCRMLKNPETEVSF